jgi:hypothetical protein
MPIDLVYIKQLIAQLENDLELLKEAVKEFEKSKKSSQKKQSKKHQVSPKEAYRRARQWYLQHVKPQQY